MKGHSAAERVTFMVSGDPIATDSLSLVGGILAVSHEAQQFAFHTQSVQIVMRLIFIQRVASSEIFHLFQTVIYLFSRVQRAPCLLPLACTMAVVFVTVPSALRMNSQNCASKTNGPVKC